MANSSLKEAKASKNDEFYTQFHDIEIEMNAYLDYDPNVFRGKTILFHAMIPNGVISRVILRRGLMNLV